LHHQTYRPIEVVVIDDGSRDATVEVVKAWAAQFTFKHDFVVQIIRQANAGASVARNRGLQESRGELIQFLDSDDLLDRHKIELQVQALQEQPDQDFAYGPVATLQAPERIVYCQSSMNPRRMILKSLVVPTIQTMSPLLRRSMLEQIGPWNPLLPPCDDWEYFSRAVVLGCQGVYVPDAYSLYRMHDGERLSTNSKLFRVVQGRFGQIDSMLRHAPEALKIDSEFINTAAWQLLIATARFVAEGWKGDDKIRYRQAFEIGRSASVRSAALSLAVLRDVLGRRGAARLFLVFPWVFYRWAGLRLRIRRYWASRH
jgi:glycosyltransferase involved in cell wall biosynthesis